MKYVMTYWLNKQSRLFSEPERTLVPLEYLEMAVKIAIENHYEIESIVKYEA